MGIYLGSCKVGKIHVVSHDYTEGYNSGYQKGYEEGYAEGYKQGFLANRVSFTLEYVVFTVPEGTTWSEFMSNYYTGNKLTVNSQGVLYYNNSQLRDSNNKSVRDSDVIKSGESYEEYDPWGGGNIDPDGWT